MTSGNRRRLLIYPLALVLLTGLVYGGFVYEAEADVATLVNSAEILAQCGAFPKSIEFGERALAQEPDHTYAHVILGYAYGETGDLDASLRHYTRAVELTPAANPNRRILRLYRAEILIRAGRAGEAAREARRVLDLDPDQAQAYYTLGRARLAEKRPGPAREAFEAAREKLPGDPEPLLLLSDLERDAGNLEVALREVEEAAALRPGSVRIAIRTARLRARQGERDRAVEALVAAAKKQVVRVRDALSRYAELSALREDPRLEALLARVDAPEKSLKSRETPGR